MQSSCLIRRVKTMLKELIKVGRKAGLYINFEKRIQMINKEESDITLDKQ